MPAIGYLKKQNDDTYRGELATLTVRAELDVRANPTKRELCDPDYVVFANGMEIGRGWKRVNQGNGKEYVSLRLAVLEFGAKPITANLGAVMGEHPDHFAVIWNPDP